MKEKYSKEFMDAYKERLRRIWSGETFEYPSIFNSNFVASSATAFVGDLTDLKGVFYYNGNGEKNVEVNLEEK